MSIFDAPAHAEACLKEMDRKGPEPPGGFEKAPGIDARHGPAPEKA